MPLFAPPDPQEEAIRERERQRIKEERIQKDEREKQRWLSNLKAGFWLTVIFAVAALVGWAWLGFPTSGPAFADALERVGPPLPDFVSRLLRG